MHLCRVATIPFVLRNHLTEQIVECRRRGFRVTLVSSAGPEVADLLKIEGVCFIEVPIAREIALRRDIVSLIRLIGLFRREQFEIVHSTTPKAGLLCAIAGFICRVPVRLHTFTGQAWVGIGGLARISAIASDWLIARLTTRCYADSGSQRDFLVSCGIARRDRIAVIGNGSIAGVNLQRFNLARWQASRRDTRQALGIGENARVVVYVGRLARDKGISELVDAFLAAHNEIGSAALVLVGPHDEFRDPLPESTLAAIGRSNVIHLVGYATDPERYLAIADVLCLPSYREGFGSVIIEAAAMGVPAIGSDIVGVRDAIVAGETGILVRPKSSSDLQGALVAILRDDEARRAMGQNAMSRAQQFFDSRVVCAAVCDEYERLLGETPE